jgi:sugar-specific transcriptional regulator TrmB
VHLQRVIQNLGYKPAEVKVYLSALQLGASGISDIAIKAGMPRTSVQEIISHLRKDGLMYTITRHNRKLWIAENPNKFMIMLKEREVALQAVLPELQAFRYDTGVKPTVRTFTGTGEITRVFDDIIETKHHVQAIVSWDDWVDLLGREFVEDFITRRYQHFLKIKLLTTNTALSREIKKHDDQELRTTRFLSSDSPIRTSNFIYGNKVAIISLNRKLPVATIIEDEDIHDTMLVLFESLWQKSAPQL